MKIIENKPARGWRHVARVEVYQPLRQTRYYCTDVSGPSAWNTQMRTIPDNRSYRDSHNARFIREPPGSSRDNLQAHSTIRNNDSHYSSWNTQRRSSPNGKNEEDPSNARTLRGQDQSDSKWEEHDPIVCAQCGAWFEVCCSDKCFEERERDCQEDNSNDHGENATDCTEGYEEEYDSENPDERDGTGRNEEEEEPFDEEEEHYNKEEEPHNDEVEPYNGEEEPYSGEEEFHNEENDYEDYTDDDEDYGDEDYGDEN